MWQIFRILADTNGKTTIINNKAYIIRWLSIFICATYTSINITSIIKMRDTSILLI